MSYLALLLLFHITSFNFEDATMFGQVVITDIPSGTYDLEKQEMVFFKNTFSIYIKRGAVHEGTKSLSLVTYDNRYDVVQVVFRSSVDPVYIHKLKDLLAKHTGYTLNARSENIDYYDVYPITVVSVNSDKVKLQLKDEGFKSLEYHLCENSEGHSCL